MKILVASASACILIMLLNACGSDTTVVHDRPVIIQQAPGAAITPTDVERNCPHGYDNRTRSCY